MTTLPANSTFLPVLDDLLSPDFRIATIPGQTPQTPAETPVSASGKGHQSFGENHTGPLTTKVGFTAARESDPLEGKQMNGSLYSHGSSGGKKLNQQQQQQQHHHHHLHLHTTHRHNAASKIQKWWKSRNARVRVVEQNGVDIKAERAKHAIRHNRTEDHIRFLETEVHRLKSALVAERKLRSLQLEAIRSLWSQVQKVSSMPSSTGRDSIMTQSMPNGLPEEKDDNSKGNSGGCMSMSLHGGLADRGNNPLGTVKEVSESSPALCECTKEIKNLRESLTGEMAQLRNMIDQLKLGNGNGNVSNSTSDKSAPEDNESMRISQVKRPLTLNLTGVAGKESSEKEKESSETGGEGSEQKKEIAGYANQMASSILEGAVEKEEPDKEKETETKA